MQELTSGQKMRDQLRGSVVAVGNFDGLHRGHQELLTIARTEAARLGRPWGMLTFEPHPRTYFKPGEPIFRLTPAPLKARLAKALGADILLTLAFDGDLASMSPDDFITNYLVSQLGVSHVVTGYDFHFGKGRKGTSETLSKAGAEMGFGVTIVDQVTDDGDGRAPFASTSIRSALRRGHVRAAANELGYNWIVMGEVVHGDKRGRTIGFPTANIIVDAGAEPFRGIYAVDVYDATDSNQRWMGAAYFGDRPTFNTNRTFLEVYMLDQDIDLYDRTLMVSFVDMIRGDKTFKSVDDLVTQMKADCADARRILQSARPAPFPLALLQAEGKI